jgi:hypothetical protein
MPVPGPEMMRRLNVVVDRVNAEERAARDAARADAAEVDRLLGEQSAAFRELAQLYLPRLEDNVERDGWSEMQALLNSILLRKEDARRLAAERLQRATAAREQAAVRRESLAAQHRSLTERLAVLSQQLVDSLAADAEFQAWSREAATGQARLEQARASLEVVEQDAAAKLPAYQTSRLFRYLADRGFSTPAYRWRGLTRRLDRWVAQLIGFDEAIASYRFLTSAPEQMRVWIESQSAMVDARVASAAHRQQSQAERLGLPSIQAEGSRLQSELSDAEAALEASRQAEADATSALSALESADGPYYREAIEVFQALLQRTERSLVAARAAHTPELTDDQVVARAGHLDREVLKLRQKMDADQLQIAAAAKRSKQINELASRCRRAQFDHPQRIFRDDLKLEDNIAAMLDGNRDLDSVWHEMHRSQELFNPTAEKASALMNGPMGQVLLDSMAKAAGVALGGYAVLAGQQHRLPGNQTRRP